MLEPGALIAGRYRLVAPLATGGMGAVWRAEHTELASQVALKLMLEPVARSASAEKRFRREAQAAARLVSPHVVRVLDFGVHDGQPYLAMELLQGEDLAARIAARGALPLDACAAILEGIAKAVDLAHEHGVIHRDLKPANIFLAQEADGEVVKVLDFGVAKLADAKSAGSTTGAGTVGSPAYMSPEQVWGDEVTPMSDIWSISVVALEMVSGKNPFDAGPLAKVFEKIVRDELPRVTELSPGLPASLDTFFRRALERDPDQRFASAAELSGAFRDAIGDAAASHDKLVSVDRGPTATAPPRRAGRVAAVGAGLAVAAVGTLMLLLGRPPPARLPTNASELTAVGSSGGHLVSGAPSPAPEPTTSAPAATAPPSNPAAEPSSSAPEEPMGPKSRHARTGAASATSHPPSTGNRPADQAPRPESSVDEVFGIPKSR